MSCARINLMGDIDAWLEQLKGGKCIPEKDLRVLCDKVKDLLLEEANVQPVQTPVTICGDLHGQFHDLIELFRIGGDVPSTNYIFLVASSSSLGRLRRPRILLHRNIRTLDVP
eukprot:TRINITY_DN1668_c0_g1_i3.p3 TRINITY_DN1668_c0_g1~~TRINITY_DN1668_c0_g1_i3.p3  ORF type:complete len:113 (-),score=10.12 TRINITY_DN1668_c0_g1_i3:834-1172(-)